MLPQPHHSNRTQYRKCQCRRRTKRSHHFLQNRRPPPHQLHVPIRFRQQIGKLLFSLRVPVFTDEATVHQLFDPLRHHRFMTTLLTTHRNVAQRRTHLIVHQLLTLCHSSRRLYLRRLNLLICCIDIATAWTVSIFSMGSRAKAERDSRRRAIQERAKKGFVLSDEERALLAETEDKDACVLM